MSVGNTVCYKVQGATTEKDSKNNFRLGRVLVLTMSESQRTLS